MNPLLAVPTVLCGAVAGGVLALTPTLPAAAAPTCHGQRATVVGSGHGILDGTARRDVIVTNGATFIAGKGGDDLICVIGAANQVTIEAGDGDDVVDVQARGSRVDYRSGSGSDVYTGNKQYDSVTVRPDGHDVVSTGGGGDIVTVTPVSNAGRPRVALGAGDDTLYLELAAVSSRINAGPGADEMIVNHSSKQRWSFDNRRGRATGGQEVRYRWRSFESFDLSGLRAPVIEFIGSDGAETFDAQDYDKKSRELTLRMGGGDDSITVYARQHGVVDGGSGRDRLRVGVNFVGDQTTISADLAAGVAGVRDAVGPTSWTLVGLEDLSADGFQQVELNGDDGPNVLAAPFSCVSVLGGRGGNDTLDGSNQGCSSLSGPVPLKTTVTGGDGDDTMLGTAGDDGLDGGNGTDFADGRAGTDTCAAEMRTACELP